MLQHRPLEGRGLFLEYMYWIPPVSGMGGPGAAALGLFMGMEEAVGSAVSVRGARTVLWSHLQPRLLTHAADVRASPCSPASPWP